MSRQPALWPAPDAFLRSERPDQPVLFFCPATLAATYQRFRDGFPGQVTYAVKANDRGEVLENLSSLGMTAFDVASPKEMRAVRRAARGAVLHYNNPVRSEAEIQEAADLGVASYSVDCPSELTKLQGVVPAGTEVSARLKLPVAGAAYDFGSKFGAGEASCAELLRAIAAAGYRPALTFHPGTQCDAPEAWGAYIDAAARVAQAAGTRLWRLNVGGGFAAHRGGRAPDLEVIFEMVRRRTTAAFGAAAPALVCEPGRAMVADAFALAVRIKAIRDRDGAVFLNDGIYGALAEAPVLGAIERFAVMGPDGALRQSASQPRTIFGPTCDSLDKLPDALAFPGDAREGDYVIFQGMGAYSTATVTHFNGYGHILMTTVNGLV
ncbi:MAG: type III PLP-dependent enzyme [Rhodobacteraceae bacterium]|nr:type III PLP-dependent enzyme [Paracoccaceae bacterium]